MYSVEDTINKNRQLRNAKDKLKTSLKEKTHPEFDFNGIIVPKIVHMPSTVDRAMQWYFNGFIVNLSDGLFIVDPGVDFYSRFTTTGLTVKDVRGIFVSHMHLDHCGDLLIFLDMALKTQTPIDLILPLNVVDGILPEYYRKLAYENEMVNLIILSDHKENSKRPRWPALTSFKPIRLFHSVAHTFGFSLSTNSEEIVYLSDTGYSTRIRTSQGDISPADEGNFERILEKHSSLKEAASHATILICNVNDLFYNRHSLTHLAGWDVIDILKESAVKKLVLQHLSPYNAHGDNSNDLYQAFFHDFVDTCIVPSNDEQRVAFK